MGHLEYAKGASFLGFIVVCLFAMSAWVAVNGVWVEVPLLVQQLPEAWSLPSYIVIIIQLANVGPLIYGSLLRLKPNWAKDDITVYLILVIGAISCILLAFLWDITTLVNGTERSVSFLVLTFLLALVDCTSSVVYLPYISLFKEQYITALYVGEGLSGLLPSIFGLIQGVGGEPVCVNVTENNRTSIEPTYSPPRFSVEIFFIILFVLMIISIASFSFLNFHPTSFNWRRIQEEQELKSTSSSASSSSSTIERLSDRSNFQSQNLKPSTDSTDGLEPVAISKNTNMVHPVFDDDRKSINSVGTNAPLYHDQQQHTQQLTQQIAQHHAQQHTQQHTQQPTQQHTQQHTQQRQPFSQFQRINDETGNSMSIEDLNFDSNGRNQMEEVGCSSQLIVFLLFFGWINFLSNGFLPGIQSFSVLPYGYLAYGLTVRLSVLFSSLIGFLGFFFRPRHFAVIFSFVIISTLLAAYIITLAVLSPSPPLTDQTIGVVLVILIYVLMAMFFSFTKQILSLNADRMGGRTWLFYLGCTGQLGSLLGAVTSFCLVNVGRYFNGSPVCA